MKIIAVLNGYHYLIPGTLLDRIAELSQIQPVEYTYSFAPSYKTTAASKNVKFELVNDCEVQFSTPAQIEDDRVKERDASIAYYRKETEDLTRKIKALEGAIAATSPVATSKPEEGF